MDICRHEAVFSEQLRRVLSTSAFSLLIGLLLQGCLETRHFPAGCAFLLLWACWGFKTWRELWKSGKKAGLGKGPDARPVWGCLVTWLTLRYWAFWALSAAPKTALSCVGCLPQAETKGNAVTVEPKSKLWETWEWPYLAFIEQVLCAIFSLIYPPSQFLSKVIIIINLFGYMIYTQYNIQVV